MGRSPDATVNGMPPKLTFAFACLHTGDQTDDWLVRVRFSSSKEGAQSANRSVSFVLQLHGIFNPQPNPQKAMSCTTCAVFGSPRVLVSCSMKGDSMKGDVKRNITPSTGSCPGFGVGIQPVQLEVAPGLAYALGSSHKAMGCIP
jgi:hypothetical protein